MSASPKRAIPVFQLYGETHQWPTPDLLHCESIAERSRLHDWHIRPHRHADLVHVLHIAHGDVNLTFEEGAQRVQGPLLIVVPSMTVHAFRFSHDVDGHIITLAMPLATHIADTLHPQGKILARAAFYPLADQPERAPIATLVDQLDAEYRQPAEGRDALLDALLNSLLVLASRRATRRQARPASRHHERGEAHLARFQQLIEAHYHQQPSIPEFAERLGISSAHLSAICQRLAGRSAQQLLHERVLLEAKRHLTYTNMTIGQVAERLGFKEPAYFTRFFKRHVGCSPKEFRQRQA
ncbi:AraC family transcriptional regulator [Chromohalobacter marismortui]|uniref:AraC family transcriptional regulator n=1 Tax=Chromohalobacter marismortui TaxID=42055 RepID=A0A4R7NM88_9GAMM|nr:MULTISPECIES: helix-turn-helix domain-containing protein [Chromohalobacter]MCI0509671.1 helix-turn-helix domain-containing protein [Chromohalobacter sp.]MCI0593654.1 helix-turn-helix domain-containing protein [Chromohalobacter sp.]TDU21893.1 AraC family transcriptional regulator [Chromohalobacter marismortui]